MQNKKAINLRHVTMGARRRHVTYFDIFVLVDNTWIKQSTQCVDGHLKTGAGCLRKYAKTQGY